MVSKFDSGDIINKELTPLVLENTSKIYDIACSRGPYANSKHNISIQDGTYISICDLEGKIRMFYSYINDSGNTAAYSIKSIKVSSDSLKSLDVIVENNRNRYITAGDAGIIYSLEDGKILFKKKHDNTINKITYMKEGQNSRSDIVLAADNSGQVLLYDLRSGKKESSLKGNKGKKTASLVLKEEITDIKISGDAYNNTLIFASHTNGCISAFDIRQNLELADISNSVDDNINCIEVVDNRLYFGTDEGALSYLNIDNLEVVGKKNKTFPGAVTSLFSVDSINDNKLSETGYLFTGCEDGKVRLMNRDVKVMMSLYDAKNLNLENKQFNEVYGLKCFGAGGSSDEDLLFNMVCTSNRKYVKIYDIRKSYGCFDDYTNINENQELKDNHRSKDDDSFEESFKEDNEDEEISYNSKDDEINEDSKDIDENEENENSKDSYNEENDEEDEEDDEDSDDSSEKQKKKKKINLKAQEKYKNSKTYIAKEERKGFFSSL